MNNIYLDIETTRFFQDEAIKALPRSHQLDAIAESFGVAVTFEARNGWQTWTNPALLWAYLVGQRIVSWNGTAFDVPVIQKAANLAGYPDAALNVWSELDLFAEARTRTGRWYNLGQIAEANLGKGKSGDGQSAAEWLRAGDFDRAAAYCKDDVQLVVDLHLIAQREGLLLPPKPNDTRDRAPDTTYRLWLSESGDQWRLRDETNGREIDSQGIVVEPTSYQWECLDCGHVWTGKKRCPVCGALFDEIIQWTPRGMS